MSGRGEVVLRAVRSSPDPASWLAVHLAARYEEHLDELGQGTDPRPVELHEALADDAALLRRLHAALVADGAPPAAAAMYLSDWLAGSVAGAVAYGLAVAGAGFIVDPSAFRWHLHPEGWPVSVELADPVAVEVDPDHPWAGLPGVSPQDGPREVVHRAVRSVVEVVTPVVEACRGLAKVGRVGLWNEVADGIGSALAHQLLVPVDEGMLDVLRAAVATPGVPWNATPTLRWSDSSLGRIHVAQKGGCCLAYTREGDDPPADQLDAAHAEFLAAFPPVAGAPRYCTTCSFRDAADCDARQVFWLERAARGPAASG